MKKSGAFLLTAIFLLLPLVLAGSVDDEIKKLTYYAEEYETGNINYAQLVTYTSANRENLNALLGAGDTKEGIIKQDQIKKVLGEPTGYTGWVWVEGEEQEKRVDEDVPYWEKIVFDGKKIQIRLNSYPSIFKKKPAKETDKLKTSENDGKLVYRLNFYTEFKKSKDSININEKIDQIEELAKAYSSNPSLENAENLAKESVTAEKSFESYFKQSGQKCEEIMDSLFGSENKREDQKLIVNEIDFYKGDNFDAKARLEMCDDCSSHFTNLDIWLDTRGKIKIPEEKKQENKEKPTPIEFEDFKSQTQTNLEGMKSSLSSNDFEGFFGFQNSLRSISNSWNQASKDVWKQLDEKYKKKGELLGKDNPDPYWWIALEKEKRKEAAVMEDENYKKTKEFYLSLFLESEKKEFFFQSATWEKRLVEDFQESGAEICDNNKDDNGNNQIDCAEDQCGGKICGFGEMEVEEIQATQESSIQNIVVESSNDSGNTQVKNEIIGEPGIASHEVVNTVEGKASNTLDSTSVLTGNVVEETASETSTQTAAETSTTQVNATVAKSPAPTLSSSAKKKVPLYCISAECKPREDGYKEERTICGNHICEKGESCKEDCSECQTYQSISCSGKVIFSGKDENGCPLEPVCIEEKTCEKSQDCDNPLCGHAECVIENGVGVCKTSSLKECKEAECVEGEEKTQVCQNNEERIINLCQEGKWIKTGVSECESVKEEAEEEELVLNQCSTKEDCGNADDVCSNGQCVTLPKTQEIEEEQSQENVPQEEKKEQEQPETQVEESQQGSADGQLVTGGAISGYQVESSDEQTSQESTQVQETPSENPTQEQPQQDTSTNEPRETQSDQQPAEQPALENTNQQQEYKEDNRKEEENRRRQDDQQRRIKNCKDNSARECTNRYVMDCVGQCAFKNNKEQDLETCKKDCASKYAQEIKDCLDKCEVTCEKEDWCKIDWPNGENKQEKGVFMAGGMCRTSLQKTESFIFFNGWGESFDKIQNLKNKYYEKGGESDWCKIELENVIKQRKEIEKSLTQDYAVWFFEKYLSNSAEDWQQHVSGIHELYWSLVENQKQINKMLECSGSKESLQFNLINISYHTQYGSLDLWEELKSVSMDDSKTKREVASPYMKVWIFPPKEFLKYEMKKAMENGEFPGSKGEKSERKNEDGLMKEEKEMIRSDSKFMKKIKKLSDKHGGSYDGVVQIKDFETGEIVFNLYLKINEEDIIFAKPMLPDQVLEKDMTLTLDFGKIYDLTSSSEDMQKEEVQLPPWEEKKGEPVKDIKNAINGIKMFFKVRDLINSAQYEPKESKGEVKSLVNSFMLMMMKKDNGEETADMTEEEKQQAEEIKKDILDPKEGLTGEIVLSLH